MRHPPRPPLLPLALCLVMSAALVPAGIGCSQDGAKTDDGNSSGLPPDTGDPDVGGDAGDGSDFVPDNAGGGPETGADDSPVATLLLVQEGRFEMSPFGGPYETMSGELTVTEYMDGDPDQPTCTATFSLTGFAAEACDGCQAAFTVTHFLTEDGAAGDTGGEPIPGLGACMAPDLPQHEAELVLGLTTAGDRIDKRTGLDAWIPWYDAETRFEDVDFGWSGTVAIELPEEDE